MITIEIVKEKLMKTLQNERKGILDIVIDTYTIIRLLLLFIPALCIDILFIPIELITCIIWLIYKVGKSHD